MSPLKFLEYHLLSDYFFLIYLLDLLASARHIPDESDSHISLQFSVQYLLVYFHFILVYIPLFTFSSSWFSVSSMLFLKSKKLFRPVLLNMRSLKIYS